MSEAKPIREQVLSSAQSVRDAMHDVWTLRRTLNSEEPNAPAYWRSPDAK